MPLQDKYYYIHSDKGDYSRSFHKWNERFTINIFEDYETTQLVDIYILKYRERLLKPTSSPYEKVRPVIMEIFEDYYNGALRFITRYNIEDWEYYITQNSKGSAKIEAYSSDKSVNKGFIKLELNNDIENLSLIIHAFEGIRGRKHARNNGDLITYEHFKQFLNLIFKFLSDHNSLLINHKSFTDDFNELLTDDSKKINLFDISAEKSFKQIITQLMKRKKAIERRLIENDKDSTNDRLRLRGELDGIIYSLKTIDINK